MGMKGEMRKKETGREKRKEEGKPEERKEENIARK